jgi:hypothetical protein
MLVLPTGSISTNLTDIIKKSSKKRHNGKGIKATVRRPENLMF